MILIARVAGVIVPGHCPRMSGDSVKLTFCYNSLNNSSVYYTPMFYVIWLMSSRALKSLPYG